MSVQCGHVYCLYFPIAAKDKLLVPAYIQSDSKVRFFVINTDLTEFQRNNPEIGKHIVNIQERDNSKFLNYDSWLICSEIVGGFTVDEINAMKNCHRGPIDKKAQQQVRAIISDSKLYSPREKSLILSQWPS